MARACASLALAAAAAALPASHAAQRPNFLIILTDDQNAWGDSDLGVMPATRSRIFQAGLNASSSSMTVSPICCPSRTSLFSGRYPHNLGDDTQGWCGNFTALREDTVLHALHNAGYSVLQAGKWYNEEGAFGPPYVPQWVADEQRAGENRSLFYAMLGEVRYFNLTYNANGQLVNDFNNGDPTSYSTAVVGNVTVDWLRGAAAAAAQPGGRPFVALVTPHAPHLPATPAPWYANASVPATAPRPPNWNTGYEGKPYWQNNGIDKPMSPELIAGSDTLYGQRLRTLMSVDDLVAGALDVLEETGALDNTYVIYTSDHGYHLGQFGIWAEKATPLETDVRVPLAIRGPGIAPGSQTAEGALIAYNTDLPATLLDLAGVPNAWPSGTAQRDGRSLAPLLKGSGAAPDGWRDRLLLEFVGWQAAQWLSPCTYDLAPQPCSAYGANPPAGMTNSAANNWRALRVVNASTNFLYAEYRAPVPTPAGPAATNFTVAFDLAADPWQLTNLALGGHLPPATLAQWSRELWAVAHCAGAACP